MDEHAPLAGDWALWRLFAVRSAGFPVGGLDAFARATRPAGWPRWRATRCSARPSRGRTRQRGPTPSTRSPRAAPPNRAARQREEIVASYWQPYCAKADTIGFFGPLAWGEVAGNGPPPRMRSGPLVRERAVHLESWGVQALAMTLDESLVVAGGPHTERELRMALERHADPHVRNHGRAALDRLETARDAGAAASPPQLPSALAALDATFTELTGGAAVRNPGRAYGARTLAYLDCMRDLEVTIGPGPRAAMAPALHVLFEAGRWFCGEVNAIGTRIVENAVPPGRGASFIEVVKRALPALMQPPPELDRVVAELERRVSALLTDPDPQSIGRRAVDAFADRRPAWPTAVFMSVDIQIAGHDEAALASGDWLAVIGDVHPGSNPLLQGVFGHRAPDPPPFLRAVAADVGHRLGFLMRPWSPLIGHDARGIAVTPEDAIHIAALPTVRAQHPRRTWQPHELSIDGHDVVDRAGELRIPLADAFFLPIFVPGVRVFELLPEASTPRARADRQHGPQARELERPRRPAPPGRRRRARFRARPPHAASRLHEVPRSSASRCTSTPRVPYSRASSAATRAKPPPATQRPAYASARCCRRPSSAGCTTPTANGTYRSCGSWPSTSHAAGEHRWGDTPDDDVPLN